ncbi:LysE family transporter [Paraburkholderia rhizosphaerae]|uniref:Homoserine/homoserine lactone efflux protein n=1 Tax=Paraburkholderia rhizosphaerae TaxID=480658 RepID=A0A4R8LLA9_9BURK|nr:LysE family transporter [Paraburkholderia rhizosphaerae]TDY45373.1 homoserine/homoserine lactone efflux protein [Paraburkholderia rhizosphaerae]
MQLHIWITYALTCCAIALSPGPGAVLAMSHGLSYGGRKATATIIGQEFGLAFILIVAGAGVGSLLTASMWAFIAVKFCGAAYLIYLGLAQWRSKQAPSEADALTAPPASWRKRFTTGLLTNATNPKGIVILVAILPQFIDAHAPLVPQLAIMTITMSVVDTVIMHGYAYGASAFRRVLRSERARRVQNRFFGGLLMGLGTALFFARRIPTT